MPASSFRNAAAAIALAAAGFAHAGLFDDDEARKRIEDIRVAQEKSSRETSERIGRLEESVRNIGVVELLRQIESLNAEIARLRGQIEVLANSGEQNQKRQRRRRKLQRSPRNRPRRRSRRAK
jgi:TolA-binding protein